VKPLSRNARSFIQGGLAGAAYAIFIGGCWVFVFWWKGLL
jgi:hypothetical protein